MYVVRKKRIAIEIVMVAVLIGAIVFAVKLLELITAASNELEHDDDA